MYTIVLICHLLVAVVLLGAVTHQAVSVWWPARVESATTFATSYRSVRSNLYTNAIIALFVVAAILGAFLYPPYRISVLPLMYKVHLKSYGGLFELKEHFIAIGLGLLPLYWLVWKRYPLDQHVRVRAVLTALLAFFVWYGFLVGHIINNIKGFGL